MNLSTADLRNYRTEFHGTWWSYRYMFLVDPKVFRFVVKGVKAIYLEVQRGVGVTIELPWTSSWCTERKENNKNKNKNNNNNNNKKRSKNNKSPSVVWET
jgi:predicted glycosyl hydrolase (DUF1957 family)